MIDDYRLLLCGVGSLVAHFLISRGLDELPPYEPAKLQVPIEVRLVEPPKEPDPEPAKPEPPKQAEPEVRVHERPRVQQIATKHAVEPKDTPPPLDQPSTDKPTTDQVFYGGSIESTSQAGKGPEIPIGNTLRAPQTTPGAGSANVKPLAEAVAADLVTKMPLPQGRCTGKYTEEAKQAAIEGTVLLDLVVDETGRTREIHVQQGLGHGLTEAAITALQSCRFSPGEKDGKPVPVRVRGFKIHFLMRDVQ